MSSPPARSEIYSLSLHDALPICAGKSTTLKLIMGTVEPDDGAVERPNRHRQSLLDQKAVGALDRAVIDRKSTRLNSSHLGISYAVFCLKRKTKHKRKSTTQHDR